MKIVLFIASILVLSIVPVAFSQITIDTNKEQFGGGDTVKITGNVQGGKSGDYVALEIKNPEGETILIRTVQIGDTGEFYLNFKIPESGVSGNYEIIANSQQEGQTVTQTKTIKQTISESASAEKGSGCLIATATYGSELAPQVQQLRELRDNSLLQTASGTSFMTGFNQFYYSFSPTIADYERENTLFKEVVKIAITPMLSTLSIMTFAENGSESEILGLGISVIALNIGMYFVAPTIVIHTIRKKFHSN